MVSDPTKGFLKAISFYLNYWLSGGFRRYEKDFGVSEPFEEFRLLVVTTSLTRLQNMREATTALPFPEPIYKSFFWATTFEELTPETLFTPLWRTLNLADDRLYRIG